MLLGLALMTGCGDAKEATDSNPYFESWSHYLGDPGRSHYSTLSAFTPENVTHLEPVWTFESPDPGQMQMNPLVVDTLLFGVSAAQRAFALDARNGELVWLFGDTLNAWFATSRGLSYWENKEDKRILFTQGSDLWALDARTGEPVTSFGEGGKIDMRSGLPEWAREKFLVSSTPGTIYKDLIIMPTRVSEGAGAAPGDIMAFNIRTGAVAWRFHTIPLPETFGYDSWENLEEYRRDVVGGANNWTGAALDVERGILYVPTGSAAPDFYGGVRKGQNLFANCLLALDANSGKRIWHYQLTHHDIWDRDPPAPPNLLTVEHNGERIPAVSQTTKQGYVYLFNRLTGEPLFEIEEKPMPPSELPGEEAWPTQPIPVKPAPFARQIQDLSPEEDISPYAPNPGELRHLFETADRRQYAPPGTDPVLLLPGYDGAAEWGGAGADPENGILYVNSNEMAWFLELSPAEDVSSLSAGQQVYQRHCAICHQKDLSGAPASGYPSLIGIGLRKNASEISQLISRGKGMMPGFPQIDENSRKALMDFLLEQESKQEVVSEVPSGQSRVPFEHRGYHKFLDANGLPGISPPWGTLHAIDMNSGEYLWQIPLGDTEALKAQGHPQTGTENYGGPVITENGLLFIAATKDGYFRAFDRHKGTLLWEYKLPAAAFATPTLYEVNGRQYIALACGGEKLGTPAGNTIMAFGIKNVPATNK